MTSGTTQDGPVSTFGMMITQRNFLRASEHDMKPDRNPRAALIFKLLAGKTGVRSAHAYVHSFPASRVERSSTGSSQLASRPAYTTCKTSLLSYKTGISRRNQHADCKLHHDL